MKRTDDPHNKGLQPALQLAVAYRVLEELKPDPANPRTRDRDAARSLARSIETFGFNVPVLIDQNDRVIAGHGRIEAARSLGLKQAPTIRLEHLTDAQAKAFMIADNRLSELAEWDERLLGETLKDLSLQNLNFDLEAIGFHMGEIDLFIEGLTEPAQDSADLDDLPAAGPTICKLGDVFVLGSHRLICADARDVSSYAALMAGARAHIVFSDPPYNVAIAGHVSGMGAIQHREFAMASGEMSDDGFREFLDVVCERIESAANDGALIYLCMDWRHIDVLLAAGKQAFAELKNICVWVKTAPGMGSLYRSQHEMVAVFKKGGDRHRNNVQLGKFGRSRSNVWNYPGMTGFGRKSEEGDLLALHPTVKPVRLVADALLDASARGDIVLDPFLGSGSTLIAAERIGRRCFGIELDPAYCDVIIRRWQRLTGERALHEQSGRGFDEIEAEGSP